MQHKRNQWNSQNSISVIKIYIMGIKQGLGAAFL